MRKAHGEDVGVSMDSRGLTLSQVKVLLGVYTINGLD